MVATNVISVKWRSEAKKSYLFNCNKCDNQETKKFNFNKELF